MRPTSLIATTVVLLVAATTTAAQSPSPSAHPTPAGTPVAAPAASCPPPAAPAGSPDPAEGRTEVALEPVDEVSGDRVYTLGGTAMVEEVVSLELLEASRGWSGGLPPPEGQAAYTFLVRFSWDGTQPRFLELTGGYYNAINFSLRDDQEFEYPVLQEDSVARQPQLLFGEVAEGQSVRGWVTFHAPAEAGWVELTYSPIADARVFFRVAVPDE